MAVWTEITTSRLAGAFRLDPQFWHPTHVALELALKRLRCEPFGSLVTTLRKGVFQIPASEYVDSGVPFYRSANVGRILPRDSDLVYITDKRDKAEHKTSLGRGDLMIAKTGNEAAAVVMRPRCNVSQDVIAVRVKKDEINPFYLAVFLNTRVGFSQMQRWFQGQSQMHLSLPDTRNILVPLIDGVEQEQIEELVIRAHGALGRAEARYIAAERLLIRGLQMEGVEFKSRLTYAADFSAVVDAGRLDAQFYQPRFAQLLRRLKALKATPLSSLLVEPVRKGVTPEYVADGDVPLINSQHLGRALLDIESVDRTSAAFYAASPKAHLRLNDVLVYSTGAYVGRTNVLLDDVSAMAGLHVLVVRPDPKVLDPSYAAVVLNSTVGLMQTDMWATGSAQRDLYPRHVERFLIPVLPRNLQIQVASMVREAHEARKSASESLAQARATVEARILGPEALKIM